MELVVETKNLTKVYEGKVVAVDNVDLKVPKGVIAGLIGHNGAGKTTLISMLVGLTLPTKGSGKVLGYDIIKESLKIRRKVGLLPEGFGFYDHMTAHQNLLYLAELNGIKREEAERKVVEVLKIVGLEEQKDLKVKAFSRGMKQRLGIAQALLKDPQLLILDEPTVGIDPEGAIGFKMLMKRLVSEGKTIILSTHLLHELGDVCDYIILMKQGKILTQGFLKDLQKEYEERKGYVYEIKARRNAEKLSEELRKIGEVELKNGKIVLKCEKDSTEEINSVFKKIDGLVLEEFRVIEPSLENLFLYYYYER